ncbi:MAG: PAS domain S-box protein [Candidatus Acidiferrales bacterium]
MEIAARRLSWNVPDTGSIFRVITLVCLVAILSYSAARLSGALVFHPQMLSPLWPGCAILVAILLLSPRRIWPILIAAALASFAIYDLQSGVQLDTVLRLLLADSVEVITAALLVSYSFDGVPKLDSIGAFGKYALSTVILAPLVVSCLATLALPGNHWINWRVSFFSEAIAFLALPPAIWGWCSKGVPWSRKSREYYFEATVLLAALTLFGLLIFVAPGSATPPALLYALVPFLLCAALRFGSTGVSTATIIISVLSIWGAVHGRGPFTGQMPLHNVLSLQLFLLFATAPFMVLAVLVEAHKSSQQALKKSEEKFSIAFRECPSAFALSRLQDNRYLEVNEAFEYFTGYKREEIIGRTPFDIRLWENPSHRAELLTKLRTEGKLRNEEARFRTRNGGIRIGLSSVELIEIDGQQCLLSLISDITELKQAQELELRHAAIVESSDDAIISKDLDGNIVSWNAAARRLFGYSESEIVGKPIETLIPHELLQEEGIFRQRLRTGERVEHFETVRIAKDGRTIPVSLTVSSIRDAAGAMVGFSTIARDITERKRIDQDLLESEQRFRLVADSAPVLIWMSGVDKLCTFFNKGWLDFTGRTPEQEMGEGWASGLHPEDLERCLGIYSSAFDDRVNFEMEYRLRRYDGKYRWIVDYGVPRFESDGTFRGYIGSCVDITDRKLTADSLEELSGRLITAQEEERSRIARELHDDFSQRLALLGIVLSQLWKKRPESAEEERIVVRDLWNRTQEMASDVHRLSHQLHSSKLQHLGLGPALAGLCEEVSERYGIQVEFTEHGASSEIPKIVALCLFRVAQEALSNVVKHSRAQRAQVDLVNGNQVIGLRVADAGSGFDVALRGADVGIGLAGMRERLRLVGGRLSVESIPTRGTAIFGEIPLSVSANEALARMASTGGVKL